MRPRLGAHMSIAGGYFRAVQAAAAVGCDCVQLFTKNNNQWRGKPISDADTEQFQASLAKYNISDPLSHASYLINLASPDRELRDKSIGALADELRRADQLGIPYVVVHPGAFTTSSLAEGIDAAASSVTEVIESTSSSNVGILLENTAGQGSTLGSRFEELAEMLLKIDSPTRCGICIDTCHAFAAGYDLTTEDGYCDAIQQLDKSVGLASIKAFHLNDSKKGLGSRVDRHEHIGLGQLGTAAFCRLLNDPRFAHLPMYLETKKGTHEGEDWDAINLRQLRDCFQ